jgi:succinate-semialdehyde dehydrogenase/glutarate-semialdehyde dehydrogenase
LRSSASATPARPLGGARVGKLSFTGSTAVGQELIRRSAENVARLSLERGGHAPYIVLADVRLHRRDRRPQRLRNRT